MNTQSLEALGLTRNESITYMTLLKIGPSKTGELLKTSGLNSGKIYEILDSLKSKGLVSETINNNIKIFTAAPPQQLQTYLDQKKEQIAKQEEQVKTLIPELGKLRDTKLAQKRIVTYTGFRGIITAAEEALAQTPKGSEIISLGISDINDWSQNYWVKWERMREEKQIRARYILSEKGNIYKDLQQVRDMQVKFLELDTPVGIDIYGKDIILILHYQEPISVTMIHDEHTVTTFRSYFEVLWQTAKKK